MTTTATIRPSPGVRSAGRCRITMCIQFLGGVANALNLGNRSGSGRMDDEMDKISASPVFA